VTVIVTEYCYCDFLDESSEDEVDADFDAPEIASDEDEVIVGKDGVCYAAHTIST
jgi:hypothetical protein